VAFWLKFHVLTPFLDDVPGGGAGVRGAPGAAAGVAEASGVGGTDGGTDGDADASAEAEIDGESGPASAPRPAATEPGPAGKTQRLTATAAVTSTRHTATPAAIHHRRRSTGLR